MPLSSHFKTQKNRAFDYQMPGFQDELLVLYYFAAGAAGAGAAGAAPGAAGAAGAAAPGAAGAAPGAAGAPGAPGAAGAGAGASVLAGSAGFCSSAFLQPTTANENVTTKSSERMMANTFFIKASPPFQ